MAKYARIVDGVVAEIYTPPADIALEDCFHPDVVASFVEVPNGSEPEPGWLYDGDSFTAPELADAVPVRTITSLAFMERLSLEKQAIITVAAAQSAAAGEPALQLFLLKLAAAQQVDLDDSRTTGGVAAMQAAGLLTQTEADTLLADASDA